MKKLYLVRHGETTANVEKTVQGADSELSEIGKAQAEMLAKRLSQLSFQNLFVSDHMRTRQTAEILAPYITVPPIYLPLVREVRRPSELIGKSRKGPEYYAFKAIADEHRHDPAWHFSDEENYFDIIARVKEFLAIVDTKEGDTVTITHGRFIIFVMMYVIMGGKISPEVWSGDMDTFKQMNTGITVLTYKEPSEHWALTTYNDHAHFAE